MRWRVWKLRIFIGCVAFIFVFPDAGVLAETALPDSLEALEAAVADAPKDGDAWVRLGTAYLDAGDLKAAEKAFKKAVRYAKSAAAYNGRGRVLMAKGTRYARNAFPYFRRALRIDPTCIEAQLSIARTHILLGESDAEGAFRKAIAMDSTYAPVYLELADWYLAHGYEVYADELSALYKRYLSLRADDVEGHYGLALLYTNQKQYGAVLEIAERVMDDHPEDPRWFALSAQAHAARGDADRALVLFDRYLAMLPASERALYEDLSLVALGEDLAAYGATPEGEREAFLGDFWQKRDPMLVSGGKARRVEHYRRVWYARTHFTDRVTPWDRRGEVYIRYGEPDYRSRSGFPNPPPEPAVEVVKERISYEIGAAAEGGERPEDPELFFAPEELSPPGELSVAQLTGPMYPVGEFSPWEAWVYTGVGGGIELTFVDETMNGKWDFPPPPDGLKYPAALIFALAQNHPASVLQAVASRTPEYFDVPPGMEPLEFYYDLASFRGGGDQTILEVYCGIPPRHVEIAQVGLQTQMHVKRTVVLSDREGETVYRAQDELRFAGIDTTHFQEGTFVPDMVALNVPPGEYRLAVQVTDQGSGKWGIYVQDLAVPAYRDSLEMSDLELAWLISETPQAEKYQKGDVWVIPMPSRNYLNSRSAQVYYEVYNLRRDPFGQTRYRVDYTIQQDIRKGVGVFGALGAGLKKLIAGGKPQVAVGYERTGRETWEPIYLELETKDLEPGLNQIAVTVTDLVGGGSVSGKAMFRVSAIQEADQRPPGNRDAGERVREAPRGRGRRRR